MSPTSKRLIPLEPLTPAAFAPFGTVVQNPATANSSSSSTITPTTANQGSATKYADISGVDNFYHLAPSRKPARLQMSMFACRPRELRKDESSPGIVGLFDVNLLERHPFTTQTFLPMGLAAHDPSTCYLVIVAPTTHNPTSRDEVLARPHPYPVPDAAAKRQKRAKQEEVFSNARPKPFDNDKTVPGPARIVPAAQSPWLSPRSSKKKLDPDAPVRVRRARLPKRSGPPNLVGLRAFIARGDQGVTYGAGTWHAPMVVLGAEPIDFVVVQFANQVGIEDCQEVDLVGTEIANGVSVAIDEEGIRGGGGMASLRSKL
jgi:ureidoglycolate lyase